MASPEEYIVAAIEESAELDCYPLYAPEGAELPYAVYQRTATDRTELLSGLHGCPTGTFTVTLYASSYTSVKSLASAAREALDNFNGDEGGLTIQKVAMTDERDGDPVFFDGRDTATFLVEQTYTIRWEE